MNIPLKMNRDFEKAMAALNERYGEDFEFLNGFHETQLNFSDFIDGFIDKNVADILDYIIHEGGEVLGRLVVVIFQEEKPLGRQSGQVISVTIRQIGGS